MLNKEAMEPDDFDSWREGSKWFFDALKERQQEYQETVDNLLAQFAATPYSFPDIQKQNLIALTHRCLQIEDICALKHEDLVEVDDDANG